MDESIEGGSHAADQSFSGGLSTTDFEGASLEVRLALIFAPTEHEAGACASTIALPYHLLAPKTFPVPALAVADSNRGQCLRLQQVCMASMQPHSQPHTYLSLMTLVQ